MKWIELNLEILSSTTADSQRQFSAYSLFDFENKRQKIKTGERFYKQRAVQPWLQPLLLQRARGFGFSQNPQMKSSEPSYIRGPRNLLTLDKIYMCLPAGFLWCVCVCVCVFQHKLITWSIGWLICMTINCWVCRKTASGLTLCVWWPQWRRSSIVHLHGDEQMRRRTRRGGDLWLFLTAGSCCFMLLSFDPTSLENFPV